MKKWSGDKVTTANLASVPLTTFHQFKRWQWRGSLQTRVGTRDIPRRIFEEVDGDVDVDGDPDSLNRLALAGVGMSEEEYSSSDDRDDDWGTWVRIDVDA